MTDRTYDINAWLETYKDTFSSFTKAHQDGFMALERFARFHYAVAGDVLESGLAQTKAAMGTRAPVGTQAVAELFQKQAELGTQLSEKLQVRAKEFSALATEVQQQVGSFADHAAKRSKRSKHSKHSKRANGARKAA